MTATSVLVTRVLAGLGAAAVLATAAYDTHRDMLRRDIEEVTELPTSMTSLTVDGSVGRLFVERVPAGTRPQVITRWVGIDGEPWIKVDTRGGAVTLDSDCDGIGGQREWTCNLNVEVLVPAGVDVAVDTRLGAVNLADLDATVDVTAQVGAVFAERLSGPVTIRSETGAISLEETTAQQIEVRTTLGAISVESLTAPERLVARTTTGAVYVGVPDDGRPYNVSATTRTGQAEVLVDHDPAASRAIEATATTGAVSVDYGTGHGPFGDQGVDPMDDE